MLTPRAAPAAAAARAPLWGRPLAPGLAQRARPALLHPLGLRPACARHLAVEARALPPAQPAAGAAPGMRAQQRAVGAGNAAAMQRAARGAPHLAPPSARQRRGVHAAAAQAAGTPEATRLASSYDAAANSSYWATRPAAVLWRLVQVSAPRPTPRSQCQPIPASRGTQPQSQCVKPLQCVNPSQCGTTMGSLAFCRTVHAS